MVTTNLTESDGSWLVSVGLLDTSGRWCRLAGSLGSKLLTWGLATSGFTVEMKLVTVMSDGDVKSKCLTDICKMVQQWLGAWRVG